MKAKGQRFDRAYYRGKGSNYIFWYGNLWPGIFWRRRTKLLTRFVRSGVLLDIGCALGFFIGRLKKKFDVYGVDISDYAVAKAKKIVAKPEQIKAFDIRKAVPFKNKFNAITVFDTMEYIADPLSVLEILYSSLERHGLLYMEVALSAAFINRDSDRYYRPLEEWLGILREARFEPRFMQTYYTIGFRAGLFPSRKRINYCSIIANKVD